MNSPAARPKYLNLLRIRMPVGAITSIAHRLSGVMLFIAIPFLIYGLDLSLQGSEGFADVQALLASAPIKLISIAIVWALIHHLLAGIRFLLLDLHIGIQKSAARTGAWIVNIGAAMAALIYTVSLL